MWGSNTSRPNDALGSVGSLSVHDLLLFVFIVHLLFLSPQERELDLRAFFRGQLPHRVCLTLKIYTHIYSIYINIQKNSIRFNKYQKEKEK